MLDSINIEQYFSSLRTDKLGRSCVYKESVESTIDVAAQEYLNTLVIAKEQTKGRGQGSKQWVSPPGCAMASVRIAVSKTSNLSKRICFLQHILAMSAAWTLNKIDGSKLGKNYIKLKWPNDIIYLKDSKPLKIGGVLVHIKELISEYDVTMSFGLNVFNKEPTTCVSEILGTTKGLSIDLVVAEMMNFLEDFTYNLDDEKYELVKAEYIERCLQMGTVVRDEKHGALKVRGVDDDGFLIGESITGLHTITKIV